MESMLSMDLNVRVPVSKHHGQSTRYLVYTSPSSQIATHSFQCLGHTSGDGAEQHSQTCLYAQCTLYTMPLILWAHLPSYALQTSQGQCFLLKPSPHYRVLLPFFSYGKCNDVRRPATCSSRCRLLTWLWTLDCSPRL